ncbi:MAG TPA: ABC transporter permease [Pyrinomonadaceae bacterium]|jgi:ABC-type lipoprotein release transport system permease subunit|nr:ABC transporter permease [Pyrinomonadaceae bacterium]
MLTLVLRNLAYYRRTNLAVVFGVGVAVAVLAGALLVGESVRASLRGLFLQRLGRASHVASAPNFFRERLAGDLSAGVGFKDAGFDSACPVVVAEGVVTHEASGRRAVSALVYGVDARFWEFHGRTDAAARAPKNDEILLSPALAAELGAAAGDAVLLRVEQPSDIPVESLHGRKDDLGSSARLTVRETMPASELGEFSVRPSQSEVRAVFVPLASLQRSLDRSGRVNTILFAAHEGATQIEVARAQTSKLNGLLRESATLEDLGVKLRALDAARGLVLESERGLINDSLEAAAREAARRRGLSAAPVFSYLANSIRVGNREVPYSLVTAFDEEAFGRLVGAAANDESVAVGTRAHSSSVDGKSLPPAVLNEWAARELNANTGDVVSFEYYVWEESGRLSTRSAEFRLAGVVPIEGEAADRDLVPVYPGISGARSLADWNPPFPVDLSRVRPQDEDYWNKYRTTPKAFIQLARGQELWRSRFGGMTSLRLRGRAGETNEAALGTFSSALRETLEPSSAGLNVYAVRAEGLAASRGATDFGEYFLYFSFFIVVSALLLTGLFFRLGVEQRLREVGLLHAVGYTAGRVRAIFLAEGLVLSSAGSLVGMAGAYAYAWLLMKGLRTWWVGAVGTTALELHAGPWPFVFGVLGGVAAALVCIVWTLRGLRRASARSLLAGGREWETEASEGEGEGRYGRWKRRLLRPFSGLTSRLPKSLQSGRLLGPVAALLEGVSLIVSASVGVLGQTVGFFGGGAMLMFSLLGFQSAWLRARGRGTISGGGGWWSVSRLGMRNATYRPGRSVLCIALIASAVFIIVAVDAFRRDDSAARDMSSGGGGYALTAESLLPLVHDPNTAEGRDALNLNVGGDAAALAGVTLARFRLRPGDDASCLNLYRPSQPRILAPTDGFRREGRFSFGSTLDAEGESKANPWLLLDREFADGAVPFVADANSAAYVLHVGVGEDFVLERGGGLEPLRMRLVATLSDSIFQSELIVSERNFLQHFPEQEGYRVFLIDLPDNAQAQRVAAVLEERLSDFGFDATSTSERLAGFHRVENTYLSTFQTLGGLGLALGTLGLAAVLLRNVLERRRELALLRAVGYNRHHFGLMIVAENALLLACGVLTGTLCALLAIAPVVASRGGRLPFASLGLLLAAVVVSGLAASLVATAAAVRAPLLTALREE